jgi:hypothetical protein
MQPDLVTDPSITALAPDRDELVARAQNVKIITATGYGEAAGWLKSIKGFLKAIEDARTRITKPLNDSLREVNAQAKEAARPFLESEAKIKRAMIAYSDEQDRIRAAEQRRANEAAEKERLRLQEIADRAAAKGQEGKAEIFAERAQAVVAPVAQRAAPKVEGVSIPKVWQYEITDEDLIPREYLVVDEVKLRKVVMALKSQTNIPGVRVFEQKRIAAGAV